MSAVLLLYSLSLPPELCLQTVSCWIPKQNQTASRFFLFCQYINCTYIIISCIKPAYLPVHSQTKPSILFSCSVSTPLFCFLHLLSSGVAWIGYVCVHQFLIFFFIDWLWTSYSSSNWFIIIAPTPKLIKWGALITGFK